MFFVVCVIYIPAHRYVYQVRTFIIDLRPRGSIHQLKPPRNSPQAIAQRSCITQCPSGMVQRLTAPEDSLTNIGSRDACSAWPARGIFSQASCGACSRSRFSQSLPCGNCTSICECNWLKQHASDSWVSRHCSLFLVDMASGIWARGYLLHLHNKHAEEVFISFVSCFLRMSVGIGCEVTASYKKQPLQRDGVIAKRARLRRLSHTQARDISDPRETAAALQGMDLH